MVYKIVVDVVQQPYSTLYHPPLATKCNTPAVAKTTTDKVLITFISSRKSEQEKEWEKAAGEAAEPNGLATRYLVAVACL